MASPKPLGHGVIWLHVRYYWRTKRLFLTRQSSLANRIEVNGERLLDLQTPSSQGQVTS